MTENINKSQNNNIKPCGGVLEGSILIETYLWMLKI